MELPRIDSIHQPETVLKQGIDILESHKHPWFLSFGTALGFYRDGDFIPDDTDIDVGLANPSSELVEALMRDFKEHFTLFRSLQYQGKQTQAAYQHPSGLIFDLCFYYPDGDYLVSYHDKKIWSDKKEHLEELELRETKYGTLPFPSRIEEYLTNHYGNWRVKSDTKSTFETRFHS